MTLKDELPRLVDVQCATGEDEHTSLYSTIWIKDLLSMALPTRARPRFPKSTPSHQEACTSLLTSSIRSQTEERRTTIPQISEQKTQSQEANKNDHMDHSLV